MPVTTRCAVADAEQEGGIAHHAGADHQFEAWVRVQVDLAVEGEQAVEDQP